MSKIIYALIVVGVLIVVAVYAYSAFVGSIYPSVHQLQVALHMEPNAQIPQLIVVDGKVFHPRYMRTEEHFGGEYAVILRLERER